jgi:hypothetical protein
VSGWGLKLDAIERDVFADERHLLAFEETLHIHDSSEMNYIEVNLPTRRRTDG